MPSSRPAALIVEDQPFVGLVASDILRESGFETFHACDVAEAAEVLDRHPEIGLVVTDAALAHRVSEKRPDIQLVVTAAGHCPTDIPAGARLLHKPYASGELRTLVAAEALLADA